MQVNIVDWLFTHWSQSQRKMCHYKLMVWPEWISLSSRPKLCFNWKWNLM